MSRIGPGRNAFASHDALVQISAASYVHLKAAAPWKEVALIRHIVFFSARADEDIDAVKSGLELLGSIPHSSVFEVSLNSKVDPLCDAVDVVVYAEFADQAALAAYKSHPVYAEATRKVK